MSNLAKKIINRMLNSLNLTVIRINNQILSGTSLFDDLAQIITRKEPVVFDVGANVGQTIVSLQETFECPRIYAFEPSSSTFKTLSAKNFGPSVLLLNNALGDKTEEKEFINYAGSTLSSFLELTNESENRFRDVTEDSRELVSVDTVDAMIGRESLPSVDLLKIDTQGYDLKVLKGAD